MNDLEPHQTASYGVGALGMLMAWWRKKSDHLEEKRIEALEQRVRDLETRLEGIAKWNHEKKEELRDRLVRVETLIDERTGKK